MPKQAIPLLLETIKIEGGMVHNLEYHQKRCDKTLLFYHAETCIDLKAVIIPPPKGLYRCRILYRDTIASIEYIPYVRKEIRKLTIVHSDIAYPYKYANRTTLDTLVSQHPDTDDVLIVKEGYITDTSICNIAFFDGKTWITPDKPLLQGTMRQKLIEEGFLEPKPIKEETLPRYTHVALMNAMLGFKILKHSTICNHKGIIYDY